MERRLYIQPEIKVRNVEDSLMEVLSLPKTGGTDDPSIGEGKEFNNIDEEKEYIIKRTNVWDDIE